MIRLLRVLCLALVACGLLMAPAMGPTGSAAARLATAVQSHGAAPSSAPQMTLNPTSGPAGLGWSGIQITLSNFTPNITYTVQDSFSGSLLETGIGQSCTGTLDGGGNATKICYIPASVQQQGLDTITARDWMGKTATSTFDVESSISGTPQLVVNPTYGQDGTTITVLLTHFAPGTSYKVTDQDGNPLPGGIVGIGTCTGQIGTDGSASKSDCRIPQSFGSGLNVIEAVDTAGNEASTTFSVVPINTTPTNTPIGGATDTATNTPVPPSNTPTASSTAIPPTASATPVPATGTPAASVTSAPATDTPTNSPTNTPAPPTPTPTNTVTVQGIPVVGPKQYFLELGDSLAYGYQPNGDYAHGYADDLATTLGYSSNGTYINMACPGETTTTFINGGCADTSGAPLKYAYSGAQLQAALSFIAAHPGQVSPVIINVGPADLLPDLDPSTCSASLLRILQDSVTATNNFTSIVQQLKQALGGTGDLITTTYYDPYQNECPNLDTYTQQFNSTVTTIAQQNQIFLADVYTAFGGSATPNPNLCAYVWICGSPSTVDATTAGHQVIASAIQSIFPAGLYQTAPTATPTSPPSATSAPGTPSATVGAGLTPDTATPTATTGSGSGQATNTPMATSTSTATSMPAPTSVPTYVSANGISEVGPKQYYLALGDSLAYGYQPNGDYTHGYADDLFQYLQSMGTTTLVNMSCPNETTTTFVKGGCKGASGASLKYGYSGDQLDAAINFIKAHPGQVSPVTINLGAADLLPDIDLTNCSAASSFYLDYPNVVTNLQNIMQQLKDALAGSGDVVTMNYYDPYQNQCPALVTVIQSANKDISTYAAQYNASVADVFDAFGGATTPNSNLCNYTWICDKNTSTVDATTQGHNVIAQAFETALNYSNAVIPSSPGNTSASTGTGTTSGGAATATATPKPGSPAAATATAVTAGKKTPTKAKASCPAHPAKLTLSWKLKGLKGHNLTSGQTLTAAIHTLPRLSVTLTVKVQQKKTVFTGKGKKRKKVTRMVTLYQATAHGKTGKKGQVSPRLHVTYRPSKSVTAQVSVATAKGCSHATRSTHVSILPAHKKSTAKKHTTTKKSPAASSHKSKAKAKPKAKSPKKGQKK